MGKNVIYVGGTNNVSRCNKARKYGIKVSDITIEAFSRTTVTKEAIKYYKYDKDVTLEDTDLFIDEKMSELYFPNDLVRRLNHEEVLSIVHRYLEFDSRKAYPCSCIDFEFGGQTLSYKPHFIYYSEEQV